MNNVFLMEKFLSTSFHWRTIRIIVLYYILKVKGLWFSNVLDFTFQRESVGSFDVSKFKAANANTQVKFFVPKNIFHKFYFWPHAPKPKIYLGLNLDPTSFTWHPFLSAHLEHIHITNCKKNVWLSKGLQKLYYSCWNIYLTLSVYHHVVWLHDHQLRKFRTCITFAIVLEN